MSPRPPAGSISDVGSLLLPWTPSWCLWRNHIYHSCPQPMTKPVAVLRQEGSWRHWVPSSSDCQFGVKIPTLWWACRTFVSLHWSLGASTLSLFHSSHLHSRSDLHRGQPELLSPPWLSPHSFSFTGVSSRTNFIIWVQNKNVGSFVQILLRIPTAHACGLPHLRALDCNLFFFLNKSLSLWGRNEF